MVIDTEYLEVMDIPLLDNDELIDPKNRISGLIGLDFLVSAGSVIDLVDLNIYKKEK